MQSKKERIARGDPSCDTDLSPLEVAEILGVSVSTVYRRLNLFYKTQGREGLYGYKIGNRWRVPEITLKKYVTESTVSMLHKSTDRSVHKALYQDRLSSKMNPFARYLIDKGGEVISDLSTIMTELDVSGPELHVWITELMEAGLLEQTGFSWKIVDDR